MGESEQHILLVAALDRWLRNNITPHRQGFIFKDSSAVNPAMRSPAIFGYVPDIYFKSTDGHFVVIGEAKTRSDLENDHTNAQLEGFFKHCLNHRGSMIVMAVPWDMVRLAKSIANRIKRKVDATNVEVVFLEKLVA